MSDEDQRFERLEDDADSLINNGWQGVTQQRGAQGALGQQQQQPTNQLPRGGSGISKPKDK